MWKATDDGEPHILPTQFQRSIESWSWSGPSGSKHMGGSPKGYAAGIPYLRTSNRNGCACQSLPCEERVRWTSDRYSDERKKHGTSPTILHEVLHFADPAHHCVARCHSYERERAMPGHCHGRHHAGNHYR